VHVPIVRPNECQTLHCRELLSRRTTEGAGPRTNVGSRHPDKPDPISAQA